MLETCHHCGSVLLWNNGQLVCARRGCAGVSTATAFTLTDLRVDSLHVEATPWMGVGGVGVSSVRPPLFLLAAGGPDGETNTLTPTSERRSPAAN